MIDENGYNKLRKAALAMVGVEDDVATLQRMENMLRVFNDSDADLSADLVAALIETHGSKQ